MLYRTAVSFVALSAMEVGANDQNVGMPPAGPVGALVMQVTSSIVPNSVGLPVSYDVGVGRKPAGTVE